MTISYIPHIPCKLCIEPLIIIIYVAYYLSRARGKWTLFLALSVERERTSFKRLRSKSEWECAGTRAYMRCVLLFAVAGRTELQSAYGEIVPLGFVSRREEAYWLTQPKMAQLGSMSTGTTM